MEDEQLRARRGDVLGFIFHDPMTSLHSVFSVGFQIIAPLREHLGRSTKGVRAAEFLERAGISNAVNWLRDYLHRFPDGMRHRAMIAIARSCNPKILIADELTTARYVTSQGQRVDRVRELRRDLGRNIVWITHHLGVVAGSTDRYVGAIFSALGWTPHALYRSLSGPPAAGVAFACHRAVSRYLA